MQRIAIVLLALSIVGCAAAPPAVSVAGPDAETVLVTYHIKSGDETAFADLLARLWSEYRQKSLVLEVPHVIVRGQEDGGKPRFVETFTWVSHSAPATASESTEIKADWAAMQSFCEARNHPTAIEGGEVTLIVPSSK